MDKRIGIYFHLPFCAGKCAYCEFYSRPGCDDRIPAYQRALIRNIRESRPLLGGRYIDTVYFGGGTPTHYGADRLISLFSTLKQVGRVMLDAEVTVEGNPESIRLPELVRLRNAGFNRLSIGVQTADDGLLKTIGRLHTFRQAAEAVEAARKAGFDNVSLDLIYGLPSQTRESWADTLRQAIALRPEHISCYGLKIEPGTPLWEYRESPDIPDDDTQADMYLFAAEELERHGYAQYEISNFAFPGRESRHNMRYWQCEEYLGFGAGAHSYCQGRRFATVSDMDAYIQGMETGGAIIDQSDAISGFDRSSEYLMLGLRTTRCICAREFQAIWRCGFGEIDAQMQEYAAAGLAKKQNDRWRLTPKGFLVSNAIILGVLDALAREREGKVLFPDGENPDGKDQFSVFEQEEETDISPIFRGI